MLMKVIAEVESMVKLEELMPNSLGTGAGTGAPEEGKHSGGVAEKNRCRKTAHASRRWRRVDVTRWSVAARAAAEGRAVCGSMVAGGWRGRS